MVYLGNLSLPLYWPVTCHGVGERYCPVFSSSWTSSPTLPLGSSNLTILLALHIILLSLGIHDPQPPAPTCNCIEDGTGHNGLDNPEYCPTDVKSPQLSQKIQTPLALRVDCSWFSGPLKVPSQFLGLCHMELQMILLAPRNKGVHHYWVLHFIPPTDESNQSRVIRKFLNMAGRSIK